MAEEESGEISRRVMLRGAAVGGVALPLLTACGSGEAEAPSVTTGETLASTSDVPVGGGTILQEQKVVVTQPSDGAFKAFTAVCTHQQCVVASVEDGTINCECHNSTYDAATGEPTGGPAPSALEEIAITVEGDQILTA